MTDRYTTGEYARHNPGWHAEDASEKAAAVAALAEDAGLSPRSVVDVGCGAGGVAHALAERWPTVHVQGWDVSEEAIRRARALASRAAFHVGSVPSDVRADLVLCLDVAEHLPDDVGLLASLASVADTAVIRLPLDLSALDVLRPARMLEARRRYGHLHAYTRALALARLAEAGWRARTVRLHRVPPPRATTRARAVDALRRAAFRVSPGLTADLLGGWSLLALAER